MNLPQTKSHKLLAGLLLMLFPLTFGLVSLALGQDINWDLRNYHFYNGYAFLHGRLGVDIAPAQLQTYLNPLLDVPVYLLYRHLPSKLVGFLYGFVHGLNGSVLMLLFLRLSNAEQSVRKLLLAAALGLVSLIAPGFLSELGGSMHDNLISLLTLAGMYLLILAAETLGKLQAPNLVQYLGTKSGDEKPRRLGYFLIGVAGLLLGCIVGLKLTAAIFAAAMGLLLPMLFPLKIEKYRAFGLFAFFGLLGLLLSNGFWMVTLTQQFNNPLFPYYNNIFRSAWIPPKPLLDQRFLPVGFTEYLAWPVLMNLDSRRVCELKFSDIRFALVFVVSLICMVSTGSRWLLTNWRFPYESSKPEQPGMFNRCYGNFILVFFWLAFILWMVQFSIYRYIIVLELLAPLCLLLMLDRLFADKRLVLYGTLVLLAAGALSFRPFDWGRLPWAEAYVQVDTAAIAKVKNAEIVMLGTSPTSYVIPFFSGENRFLRPESNLVWDYQSLLNQKIKYILSETSSPIFLLFEKSDPYLDLSKSLVQLELAVMSEDCFELAGNMPEQIMLCPAFK